MNINESKIYIKEKIGDVLIVLNEETNESYLLNANATIILELFEKDYSVEEIEKYFIEKFGDKNNYLIDINSTIDELKKIQII